MLEENKAAYIKINRQSKEYTDKGGDYDVPAARWAAMATWLAEQDVKITKTSQFPVGSGSGRFSQDLMAKLVSKGIFDS